MSRKKYTFAYLKQEELTQEELVAKLCGDVVGIIAALEKLEPDCFRDYSEMFAEVSNRFERFSHEGSRFH